MTFIPCSISSNCPNAHHLPRQERVASPYGTSPRLETDHLLICFPFAPLQILTSQIRSEIASSSERAYPNLPISSTKSLLFLDSEGAVIEFAKSRGWLLKDGMIYFPKESEVADEEEEEEPNAAAAQGASGAAAGAGAATGGNVVGGAKGDLSRLVIANALGYARELETIV